MKTDKTKLLQDIEAMKEKLASMEEELNKPEIFKHFPAYKDIYYFYTSSGTIHYNDASSDDLKVNAYKTKEEAKKAYNKAVALEKIKRRIIELQGDWKPNFNDYYSKHVIYYNYDNGMFEVATGNRIKLPSLTPYIKSIEIARTIIKEMEEELKLIFDIC